MVFDETDGQTINKDNEAKGYNGKHNGRLIDFSTSIQDVATAVYILDINDDLVGGELAFKRCKSYK